MGERSPPTGSSSIRVLLVDDEPDILTTAEMILEKNGFHVETAPSVGEAARLLAEKPFDVIVSDYQMPGKDGLQFLKELRERGDATPFIVLTGRGREEVAIRALNLGADRYLQKGVDIEAMYAELTDAIRKCVEHRRAEAALLESEGKLSAMLQSIGDHMSMMDRDLNVLWANEIGKKIFGEDIIGKKCYEVYHRRKEPCEPYPCLTLKAFQDGETHEHDTQVVGKDGEAIYFHCTANVALRDEEGNPTAVIEISRDITEGKRAEATLRESEERYRVLVEGSPNLVGIFQDGVLRFVNRAMCERLGWTFEEMTSPSFDMIEKLVPPRFHTQVKEDMAKIFRGEHAPPSEFNVKTRDGSEISIMVHAQSIRYQGKPAIEFLLVDITERKRLEEEKLKAVEMVARSIGHDVRNPLSAIRNAAYLLREVEGEKRREMLAMIERNVVAADRTLLNLRDLTAVPTLKLAEADINRLLRGVAAQAVLPGGVKLTASYGDLPRVEVDGGQLSRVFGNLVKNAVEAMPEGGKLEVSTGVADRYIEVKVSDTGVGIPEENLGKLFTPFFTTKEKGTGLGLVGVKHIVESHGGVIKVESTVGKSTTFTVQIPRKSEG